MKGTIAERFWPRVRKIEGGCWEWQGGVSSNGYGTISRTRAEKPLNTHRLSYMLAFGEIPAGLLVCHTCDNKLCVNPAHLFLGTHSDNALDLVAKGLHVQQGLPGQQRGESHGMVKLTEATVRAMRSGAFGTATEAARKLGISVAHCCRILNHQAWKHI